MSLSKVLSALVCSIVGVQLCAAQALDIRLRPVRAGDQVVNGFVLPEQASADGFFLEVYDITGGGHAFVDRKTIDRFERGGGFSVQLSAPVRGMQRIEVNKTGSGTAPLTFDVPAPAVPAPPAIDIRAVTIGDTAVAGTILPSNTPAAGFYVEVARPADPTIPGSKPNVIDRRAIERIDAATGGFTVMLGTPLGPNQLVSAGRTDPAVTAVTRPTGPFTPIPHLRPMLYDGARIVRGYLEARTGVAGVQVQVLRSALENQLGKDYLQVKASTDIGTDGQFEVTLPDPLIAGQIVVARAMTAGQAFGGESDRVTVTDPGSWGRARAYFAGGVVFSKDRGEFSQQDLAVTLAVDKSWLQKADFELPAEKGARDAAGGRASGRGTGKWYPRQLNSFFDTRLTALPIVVTDAATATTKEQQFVNSRKGASLQIGAYAPSYGPQTSWVHEGAVNTFFVAPLFRAGIQTISGPDGQPTVNARGEPDDVFHYMAAGFAIGHQKLSGSTDQTPEMISYIHFTWGKSEAFEHKSPDPAVKEPVNPIRTMVEARLKIPYTAMQIGVDTNLGEGRDDVRFIFGTRFDIGQAISRVKGFQQ